jgi:uncharacterized BrkB/YihY/UPF0761 family membrane protein
MTRHAGRIALAVALLAWCVMMLTLMTGGLDPPPHLRSILQWGNMAAVLMALTALCSSVIALARGPQRIAGGFGLAVSLLFLLYWTGFLFVFFR